MEKTEKSILMTEGSIFKQILLFSIPLIMGNILQQMYNTVDSIIVGNYIGNDALAAVSSSTALINLLIGFAQGAAVGAGVIVSQFMGAQKRKSVQYAVHTALALAITLGIILTVAGFVLTPFLLKCMKTPFEILEQSILYLRIYSCGFLFSIIYNMTAGILNSVGNSKRSLFYLAIASFTNIILDFILIKMCHMGVEGAAIATDISQALSSIFGVLFLMKAETAYQVKLKKVRFHKDMLIKIIKVGLPSGIQNMVISFSNALVQSSVNTFGTKAMAGFGAYLKIDGFNILPILSFSMAVTTFTGQNFGAEKLDRVKKGMYVTAIMSFVYTVLTGTLIFLFAHSIISLFTQDSKAVSYGVIATRYFCPYYFIIGVMYAFAGTVRGVGKSIPPMMVLMISFCLFRVIWIMFILPYFSTIEGLYLLYPVSWTVGLILMALYTWKGKWLNNKEKYLINDEK